MTLKLAGKVDKLFSEFEQAVNPYLLGYLFSKGIYAQRAVKGKQFYAEDKALLRDTGSAQIKEFERLIEAG